MEPLVLLDPLEVAQSLPPGTPPEAIRAEYQRQLWAILHTQLDAVIQASAGDIELAALAGQDLRVTISDEAESALGNPLVQH